MEEKRANRRLVAMLLIGSLICAAALGVRFFHRKPIAGLWIGYNFNKINGKMVPDKGLGEFRIMLSNDGSYLENGNDTSGTWAQDGDKITLTPKKFRDMTPDEHRKKYLRKSGKVSPIIEALLSKNMQAMTVTYLAMSDQLTYDEPTLHFQYERAN